MAKLNQKIIEQIIKEANEKIIDSFIAKITVLNKSDILLGFSHYKDAQLLISINHNNPFICFVEKKEDIVTENGNLAEQLKQKIKNTKVEEIIQLNNDKIIQIKLGFYDVFNLKHHYLLILELINHHPNLIIVDENNNVIFANHYTDLSASRVILKSMSYTLPDYHEYKDDNSSYAQFKNFASEYFDKILKEKELNKYKSLINYINKEIKKCYRKKIVLNDEIEENKDYELYKDHGQMILTYQYDLDSLKVYINDNNLSYDESISITDNANKYFKIYKKKKATIAHDNEELFKNDKRLGELNDDLSIINSLDELLIQELEPKYPKFIKKKVIKINPKYPFYVDIAGVRYGYGRNAMQNDYLTFKQANKNHYFFHIHGYAGAHVICMKEDPTDEEINIASQIAIYVSKKDIGDVDYAKVATIKKGHQAGEVILSSYKTTTIKYISEDIKKAMKRSSRLI